MKCFGAGLLLILKPKQDKVNIRESSIAYSVTRHSIILVKHICYVLGRVISVFPSHSCHMAFFALMSFLTPPDNHEWDIPEWEGLESRYEHCSFVPESCPQSLWVFGGAQQSGNRNCIQNIQLTGKSQFKFT